DCQRIPLAFRHVLRLMNLEFPNDNHHSYIIKDGSKRCKAGVAGLKLLITKERETGIEPATSSLGSWHSTAELLPLTYDSAIYLNSLSLRALDLVDSVVALCGFYAFLLECSTAKQR